MNVAAAIAGGLSTDGKMTASRREVYVHNEETAEELEENYRLGKGQALVMERLLDEVALIVEFDKTGGHIVGLGEGQTGHVTFEQARR